MIKTATLQFLDELSKHNNKAWFDAHRNQYDAARQNFQDFIQELIDRFSAYDADLEGLTAKSCMFRINRDVRFSKNKQPYKTNLGASMDRGGKKSGFAGYYFHLEPGKSFAGGGVWMPDPANTRKIRQEIDYCLSEFEEIITDKKFKKIYGGLYHDEEGIKLVNIPRDFEKDNPAAEYLKYKSWLAITHFTDAEVSSKQIINKTIEAFKTLQPLNKFLNRALEPGS